MQESRYPKGPEPHEYPVSYMNSHSRSPKVFTNPLLQRYLTWGEGIKGKAKEVAGVVTGRDDLKQEGEAQQDKADAQREAAQKEAEAEKARAEAKANEARQKAAE